VKAAFSTEHGERTLQYLTNITLNRVMPPSSTDAELRHHEGARNLVGLIIQRIKLAEEGFV
jgi:hypothetical protein